MFFRIPQEITKKWVKSQVSILQTNKHTPTHPPTQKQKQTKKTHLVLMEMPDSLGRYDDDDEENETAEKV